MVACCIEEGLHFHVVSVRRENGEFIVLFWCHVLYACVDTCASSVCRTAETVQHIQLCVLGRTPELYLLARVHIF